MAEVDFMAKAWEAGAVLELPDCAPQPASARSPARPRVAKTNVRLDVPSIKILMPYISHRGAIANRA